MKGGHFNRDLRDIIADLQASGNFKHVLVISSDQRGGAPKIWGTGTEQDSTQLLKQIAPEFAGLAEPV
jgi:hypothetical protein